MPSRYPTEQDVREIARTGLGLTNALVVAYPPRPGKAAVFRVEAPGGAAFVAKLQGTSSCELEARVYQDVLAQLPNRAIRCHGVVPSGEPNLAWLLTDYAAGIPFDPGRRDHGARLAAWLAALHEGSRHIARSGTFPDHGSGYWFKKIANAHRILVAAAAQTVRLAPTLRNEISDLAAVLAQTLDRWEAVLAPTAAVPGCLTHGDLVAKNIAIHATGRLPGEGYEPLVFDWEASGWGSPAVDLVRVDVDVYRRALAEGGAALSEETAQALGALGAIFWVAFVLIGEELSLMSSWPDRSARRVASYLEFLDSRGASRYVASTGRR